MNVMTKAHQIRKTAAVKFNCKVSEIHFGECLRMAHNGDEIEAVSCTKEIAAQVATELGGRIWEGYGKTRVYLYKNWMGISADGIDLSGLGRNHNEEMKAAAYKAAEENGLEVYEIYRGCKIAA